MTATHPERPVSTAFDRGRHVRFGDIAAAEWTKLRSVRSTVWSLCALVVVTVGLTALVTAVTMANWDASSHADRASLLADRTGFLVPVLALGQLPICVLGVLVATGEYATGTIRASVLATPRRTPILVAKAAVFASVTLVIGEVVGFAAFGTGQALIARHIPVSLHDPGVLRAVVGTGLYLAVLGLFGLGVGALFRHGAAAITTVIGLVLVLSQLAHLLPGSLGEHVAGYLPANAGARITSVGGGADQVLSPWQGFGVLGLWTAVVLGVAAYRFRRRDV